MESGKSTLAFGVSHKQLGYRQPFDGGFSIFRVDGPVGCGLGDAGKNAFYVPCLRIWDAGENAFYVSCLRIWGSGQERILRVVFACLGMRARAHSTVGGLGPVTFAERAADSGFESAHDGA